MTILSPANASRDLLGRWLGALSGKYDVGSTSAIDAPISATLAKHAVTSSVAAVQEALHGTEPVRVTGLRSTIDMLPVARPR